MKNKIANLFRTIFIKIGIIKNMPSLADCEILTVDEFMKREKDKNYYQVHKNKKPILHSKCSDPSHKTFKLYKDINHAIKEIGGDVTDKDFKVISFVNENNEREQGFLFNQSL